MARGRYQAVTSLLPRSGVYWGRDIPIWSHALVILPGSFGRPGQRAQYFSHPVTVARSLNIELQAVLNPAANLRACRPAFVVTCEFDPPRNEGIAYAEALAS